MTELTREEILARAKKNTEAWLNDPEFDARFEESMRKAQATIDHVNKIQKVNVNKLLEPFDI